MCLRGPLMRSWRRVEAEYRRKKSLMKGVVVLMVVQMVVVVYQSSEHRLPEHQQLGGASEGTARRVGPYVILFTTTSLAPHASPLQESRQEPLYIKTKRGDAAGETGEGAVKRAPYQDTAEAPSPVREEPGDGGQQQGLVQEDEHYDEEKWLKEEEEDPVIGRGLQEEFVTYRADDQTILLLRHDEGHYHFTEVDSAEIYKDKTHRTQAGHIKKNTSLKENTNFKLKESTSRWGHGGVVNDTIVMNSSSVTHTAAVSVSGTSDFKFKTYNKSNPSEFVLTYDTRRYFQDIGENCTCFVDGTDMERSRQAPEDGCQCLDRYFGVDCGIPEAVWFGKYKDMFPDTLLRRREVPRRVINGLPVNHEFALFEARMHELYDVVDVFIVAESNYTAHGDPKDLHFLTRFQEGYLKQFQHKMVYVSLGFFSSQSQKNGWVADAYLRYYLGKEGLPLLKGLHDDDLFVLSDADELPTREVITFLKVYDGYPEPISFALRWNVFGFFWLAPPEDSWVEWLKGTKEKITVVASVATVGMLRKVLLNNVFYIRKKHLWRYYKLATHLRSYRDEGYTVGDWVAGTPGHYAGWHCSWCFSPENIVHKMDSAQADDQPRWGDFPEKKNLSYITSRIWQGLWFNDKDKYLPVTDTHNRFYAPRYLLEHPEQYRSILFHPGHPLNRNKPWRPP